MQAYAPLVISDPLEGLQSTQSHAERRETYLCPFEASPEKIQERHDERLVLPSRVERGAAARIQRPPQPWAGLSPSDPCMPLSLLQQRTAGQRDTEQQPTAVTAQAERREGGREGRKEGGGGPGIQILHRYSVG